MKLNVLAFLFVALIATGSAQVPDNQAAPQAGAVLFRDNCARCHGANLEGGKKVPALADVHKKKHWTEERLTKQILNGEGKMPPFRDTLTAGQIQQLVAYLRAENRPIPQPASDQK